MLGKIVKAGVLSAVLAFAGVALPCPLDTPQGRIVDSCGDFRDFTVPNLPAAVHYFAPKPVESGADCETAVIIVHGWGDGVELPKEVPSFWDAARNEVGTGGRMPYVIAPVFPRRETMEKFGLEDDGRAHWNDLRDASDGDRYDPSDDWRGGGDADGTSVSSFDAIDRILDALSDRAKYPNLKRVTLAGFSAGGQFAWRYAAVGRGILRPDIRLDFAPMAPSSVLRLESDVRWLYGLKDRPRYAAGLTEAQIYTNLCSRRVWFGCGDLDVKKRPQTSLDGTPEARAQGENRYDRFLRFRDYLGRFPDWNRQVSFHILRGLGHEYVRAYAQPELVGFLLFGCLSVDRPSADDPP